MANSVMVSTVKKKVLLSGCGVLLLVGSTLLIQQMRLVFSGGEVPQSTPLTVKQSKGQLSELQGAFAVDSVDKYTIQRNGKDAFSLLLAQYKDSDNQPYRAVLFSEDKKDSVLPDSMSLRQSIWQEAAKAISANTPSNAVIVSWWDDGQRVHFLSGRDAWLKKPAQETLHNPVWQGLQDNLLLASTTERKPLTKMAHWLTMYSDTALAEMRQFFGSSRPVYVLVTNDLLTRLGEMVDYGGAPLSFSTMTLPAHDNLHGDIARVKQWAYEEGDGNYLVQKEATGYRLWVTPKLSGATKNSLLVRLLPFVDSLKQLPQGVHLVYQSHWGGYLSIYRIDLK